MHSISRPILVAVFTFALTCVAAICGAADSIPKKEHYRWHPRQLGPLQTVVYTEMVERPAAHGFVTIELKREDGSGTDTFRFRQRADLTEDGRPQVVYQHVKRLLNGREIEVHGFEMQFNEADVLDDTSGEQTRYTTKATITVGWHEVTHITDTVPPGPGSAGRPD